MGRQYLPILEELKAKGKAEVTVSKYHLRQTINGLKKIKSEDNVTRQQLGLMRMQRLKITTKPLGNDRYLVTFEFSTDTLRL